MLKKIQFTFTVDPKDLALLLAHAGKLDVSLLADQPATRAQLALPHPKGSKKQLVLAYAQNQKASFTSKDASVATGLALRPVYQAIHGLLSDKKLKRISKGVFARA